MKKSIVISLLAITILFGTAICSIASTGIVTTDTLRLRKEPSTNSTILELLSMDDKVSILEENNGWYKVKAEVDSKEYVGYVAMQYIKVQEPTSEETEAQGKENDTQEKQDAEGENTETTEKEETVLVKVVNSNVKVYITPLINSLVLDTTEKEEKVEITSEVKDWSYIKTENTEGWVRTENITEKEEKVSDSEKNNTSSQKTGYISANSVNFRKEASNDSIIITSLKLNDQVKVLEKGTTWTKIQYAGNVGYVATKYISDKKVTTTTRSSGTRTTKRTNTQVANTTKEETKSTSKANITESTVKTENTIETKKTNSVTGSDIVAYAKKYLGYKYVYGEESPSKGFDCSGFTTYVYKHFGYSLSRSSSAQAKNGKAVSKADLQVGDIVCFSNSSSRKRVGHVGIYIGNGKFIHAANARKGVIISNITGDGFYFVCGRHII